MDALRTLTTSGVHAQRTLSSPLPRSISITNVDFDFEVTLDDAFWSDLTPGEMLLGRHVAIPYDFKWLPRLRFARHTEGFPLEELRLKRCRLNNGTEKLLRCVSEGMKVIVE